MTRQTRVALASAVCFVLMAVVLALTPVGFVTFTPGGAYDVLGADGPAEGEQPTISVSGVPTYPTEGRLELTTVSVTSATSSLSLPEAVLAYWLPHRDTLPRDIYYPPGKSAEQVQSEEQQMMTSSQSGAVVAALREAGIEVVERPVVQSVTVGGPSEGALSPGDLVLSIEGTPVSTPEDVVEAVQSVAVGDELGFEVLRDGEVEQVVVRTRGSNDDAALPVIGIVPAVGYDYDAEVEFGIDPAIGGSSAGLVFSLGIYDIITPDPLVTGTIAGTGTITADGAVGGIGGIQQKIRGAEQSGATAFLLPEANCADLDGLTTDLQLVAVSTLSEAVESVQLLAEPDGAARLPRCA